MSPIFLFAVNLPRVGQATQIDMLVGSAANGLNSSSGFCAGSYIVVNHQRINGTSFVFSPAVPALLTVSASEGINILRNTPSILHKHATRKRSEDPGRTGPRRGDHNSSPIIHIHLRSPAQSSAVTLKAPNSSTSAPREPPSFDVTGEERVLQDIVEEVLAQGVWITRARRLRGQELVEVRPSISLAVTAALSCKECERAAAIIKTAVMKVLAKRK